MRQIKFRAWDKLKDRMETEFVIAPTSPDWSPFILRRDEEANNLLNNLDRKRGDLLGGDYTAHDWGDWYAIENYIVMQFTGLLDKNGKEIYEGDIVSCQTSNKFKYPHCGVVIFLEHTAGFAITTESIVDDQGHEQEACTFFNYCENFEIIGNIHENPDLLK